MATSGFKDSCLPSPGTVKLREGLLTDLVDTIEFLNFDIIPHSIDVKFEGPTGE